MLKILKLILRIPVNLIKQYIHLISLQIKNPTLKLGHNISVSNVAIGKYNYLANGVAFSNSSIGDYSYLGTNTKINNTTIGKFVCIGPNVMMGLGEHPTHTFVSVHPVFYSSAKQVGISFVDKNYFDEFTTKITIGNDVWIGARVLITKSVTIGNGAIIASGAIVTKDVEPYTIVAGVPAKAIKKRFLEEEISLLQQSKWWDKSEEWLQEHIDYFHDIKLAPSKFFK